MRSAGCAAPPAVTAPPAAAAAPKAVTLSNVARRLDTQGRVVNAHDGGIFGRFDGLFWLYGTVYEACVQEGAVCDGKCGYLNNTFAVYSSPDLEQWTLVNADVLPELSKDNAAVSYWEANVGFNAVTETYLMAFWSGHNGFVNNKLAIATSPSPGGPFVLAPPIELKGCSVYSDTVALFVDDDGQAYARYNTIDLPRRHVVERLSPDWLSSSGEFGIIFEKPDFPWLDGGGMMKRDGTYFVMLSFDCCFCSWGSDALVFTAPTPLGPWQPQAAQPRPQAAQPIRALPQAPAAAACNFTGAWSGVLAGSPIKRPNLFLAESDGSAIAVSGAVSVSGSYFAENSSVAFYNFPGYAPHTLVGSVSAFNGTGDSCSQISWLDFDPPGSFWCKSPACGPHEIPPANWTNEMNTCADGTNPPRSVPNMYMNPCSQDDVYGTNFTIPAQMFSLATLRNVSVSPTGASDETTYLYFGEHFKSSDDGLKSHDLQSWIPIRFDASSGKMIPMTWAEEFTLYVFDSARKPELRGLGDANGLRSAQ